MLSSGGLTTIEHAKAFPVGLLESGPAGGAIAAAFLARKADESRHSSTGRFIPRPTTGSPAERLLAV
jgi:hypothetical protein